MARVNPPGVTEVAWVTTVAVVTAPTATEINAGADLTGFVMGVPSVAESFNTADTSNLSSKRNTNIPASYGGDTGSMTVYMDDATDTAYETLLRDTAGFVAVAWYGLATTGTWAIADKVWLYPATVGRRSVDAVGRDDALVAGIEFSITGDPTENFAIVA